MFISFDNSLEDMREKILNGAFFPDYEFSAADTNSNFAVQDYSWLGLQG